MNTYVQTNSNSDETTNNTSFATNSSQSSTTTTTSTKTTSFLNNFLMNKDQFLNSRQYIYYAPITYFLHVDFVFRTISETNNDLDVCSLKSNSINAKIYLFKEFVFRFYRICWFRSDKWKNIIKKIRHFI